MDFGALVDEAIKARGRAYAPYSKFMVGAAVLADNGRIYSGANIEVASYGATMCAERSAISSAISDGARRILAVAVSGNTPDPLTPCGICRQTLAEFAGADIPVLCCGEDGKPVMHTLGELLPFAFSSEAMDDTTKT